MALTNAEKKKIKSLHNKKGRKEYKLFIAEGVRLLEEAVRHQVKPGQIVYAESLLTERGRQLVGKFKKQGTIVEKISSRDLKQISDTENHQGILGVFRIPAVPFEESKLTASRRLLVLDNITDPGNAGTLVRSAAAFGFDGVLFSEQSVDPYNPKVVRATAGAIFCLPMQRVDFNTLYRIKKSGRFLMVAADMEGKRLEKLGAREIQKCLLVIGSEAIGISPEIEDIVDQKVSIGFTRKVESLNAAVAGSIIMQYIYHKSKKEKKRWAR